MTIVAGDTEFPMNVIALIAARIPAAIDSDLTVLKRMLRPSDPTQSVGIFPLTKLPDRSSAEIRSVEPTLKTYNVVLQTLVQDTDEAACISVHSILSQRIWRMLYRDSPLHAGLTVLAVTANNSVERFQRRGITLQRYLSNEIQGTFIQTSWVEFWFETETTEN
jgi:hypothetical protein